MQYTRRMVEQEPTLYIHKCENPECGEVLDLPRVYPYGETVPKRKRGKQNANQRV
jgi:hypothetical protein